VAHEFVGTYPTAESLLEARNVARATAPELIVAMDAGARAVSLGSGRAAVEDDAVVAPVAGHSLPKSGHRCSWRAARAHG
jgi:hypothetical protein